MPIMKKNVSGQSCNKELHPLVRARERYWKTRKCVGSKAAVIVLFWFYAISFANVLMFLKHTVITNYLSKYSAAYVIIVTSAYAAILQFLFPVAGYLSDTKLGRFKAIQISLGILLLALLCLIIAGALSNLYPSKETIMTGVFYMAWLFFLFGLPGFNVNVIQFGLDQLFQTPADDQSLFIQWFLWVYYLADITIRAFLDVNNLISNQKVFFSVFTVPFMITTLITVGTVLLAYKKRNWFLIVTRYNNPYTLVRKVTKISFQDTTFLQNGGLGCCYERIMSRLDLAKEKYRGSFTNEQVEDVKAFYGVIKVIFSLVPALFTRMAQIKITALFAVHYQTNIFYSNDFDTGITYAFHNYSDYKTPIIVNGTIYSGTAFLIIPLFIFLLRPIIRDYIPGMLQRIGIGICLSLLSIIILFVVDILIHASNGNAGCMLSMHLIQNHTIEVNTTLDYQYPATALLIVQQVLTALADVIFYIAIYQFICSQSPHSMKGFLLGIFFATRGFSQLLTVLVMLPFAMNKYTPQLPSCAMVYYMVVIVVSVTGLIVYTCIARKYKLRVREDTHVDEPPHRNNYHSL